MDETRKSMSSERVVILPKGRRLEKLRRKLGQTLSAPTEKTGRKNKLEVTTRSMARAVLNMPWHFTVDQLADLYRDSYVVDDEVLGAMRSRLYELRRIGALEAITSYDKKNGHQISWEAKNPDLLMDIVERKRQ